MRRLPPNKIEQNLTGLLNLLPEETDELLQRIDQPLKSAVDRENVRVNSAHTFSHSSLLSYRVAHIYCVTIIVMVIHIVLLGPINTNLLWKMDFYHQKNCVQWKSNSTNCLMPTENYIMKEVSRQCICGIWIKDLLDVS